MFRSLVVKSKSLVTPNMWQLVLEGAALEDFPTNSEGSYIKFVLPRDGGAYPSLQELELRSYALRSFTVRALDRAQSTLTVEIFRHVGGRGVAAAWIETAVVGSPMHIRGPGPIKMLTKSGADWVLLAGDMTALPAIMVNLERLDDHVQGHAVIEVISADDIRDLKCPEGVRLDWLVNEHSGRNSQLDAAVRQLKWPKGRVEAWVACEFSEMRSLRGYLRDERHLGDEEMYISSYWKLGATDEEHKAAKKASV